MTTRFEACPACAEARKNVNLAAAADCRSCKGTGMRRTRESWVCNGCGECLCPKGEDDTPYGLVDAKVSGAYGSTHLSDMMNYKFSLCEGCLRKLFDGFKIKPHVSEYYLGTFKDIDIDSKETYEEEAAARIAMDVEAAKSKAEFFSLNDQKRCVDHNRDPASGTGQSLREHCGAEGYGILLHEDSSWPYAKRWLCERHMHNAFAHTDATIEITGHVPLTGPERCRIGLELLAEFRAKRHPAIDTIERKHIAISTLLPLLMSSNDTLYAASELDRLTRQAVPHARNWIGHRIPLAFAPSANDLARMANDWLTWGDEQGYDEAVATAKLGYPPESLWDKRG